MPEVPRPHPIKAVLAQRRRTVRSLAEPAHCNPHTLGRVVNGYVAPWPSLRRALAEELDLPEDALFRDSL